MKANEEFDCQAQQSLRYFVKQGAYKQPGKGQFNARLLKFPDKFQMRT